MQFIMLSFNGLLMVLGLFFHISTYFYLNLDILSVLVKLYVLITMLLLFGFVLSLLIDAKVNKREVTPIESISKVPTGLRWIIVIFTLITIVIFLYCSSLLSGGGTQIIDGNYVLSDKIGIIREISKSEYDKFQFIEFRMNTIMFLLFNFIETIGYFYLLKSRDV